jgi:hypothetical protein
VPPFPATLLYSVLLVLDPTKYPYSQIFQCLEMARLLVSLILILVATSTITTTHGGRALTGTERSMAEPPSTMAWDMAALRSLFPRVKTADGPARSYYNRADLEYKVPVTGF